MFCMPQESSFVICLLSEQAFYCAKKALKSHYTDTLQLMLASQTIMHQTQISFGKPAPVF